MPQTPLLARLLQRLSPASILRHGRRLAVSLVAATALLTGLASGTLLISATLPATAAAATTTLPPEGIFDSCDLDTQMSTCLQRLQAIQAGGFQVVVLDANEGSPANLSAYAAAAQQLGMKVMWEISNQNWWTAGASVKDDFPEFAEACGCSTNSSLLTYMIDFFGSLPGTYGYYAADDSMLSGGDESAVASYVASIKALDPSHPVILSSGDQTQTQQYESIGDMNAAEIYPITTSYLMPASKYWGPWYETGQEIAQDQRLATRDGKASAFILQAFSFGDNLSDGEAVGVCTPSMTQQQCWDALSYPSPADQLKLRNEVLEHAHPSIILWWSFMGTYGQAGNDTYSIYPTGATAAAQWAGLSAAVQAPPPGQQIVAHAARAKHRKHRKHHRHHHRRHHRHHDRRRRRHHRKS